MIKITIEATTKKDKEKLEYMRDTLCYHLNDEFSLKLRCKSWEGYSGGDDAYFGLMDTVVKVEKK